MATSRTGKSAPQQERVVASARVLLVQTESVPLSDLHKVLERNGFHVVARSTIKESLSCLGVGRFDALVCNLLLPAAGDGFTLVNAMRHMHPDAITMIMSNFPALRESVSALLPQADEVLVTPVPIQDVVKLLKDRLRGPRRRIVRTHEPVATILERYALSTIREWLARVNQSNSLARIEVNDSDRTGHLRTLLQELIQRLRAPHLDEGRAKFSRAALEHGKIRKQQGYTPAMLVEESRILQVCIFKTLRSNLSAVDLALVLTDVMTIADEVDSQLTQAMSSFSEKTSSENNAGRGVRLMA